MSQYTKNTKNIIKMLLSFQIIIIFSSCLNKEKIIEFPDLRQMTTYSCGASALQSVLFYYGIDTKELELSKKLKTTPDWGTEHTEIEKIAIEYGLKVEMKEKMTIEDLKKFIDNKIPVILAIQAWQDRKINYENDYDDGHYVVAIGYDDKKIIFEDPSTIGRGFLTYEELEKRWHDITKKNKKLEHFGMAIWGKPLKYHSKLIEHID